ncbi:MAG: BPL-N domain-containing protein, partial [Pseudomonadota bacterium]
MKTKKTPHIFILWDESYLWGLLVWRAMEALGLPYTLVKGHEIAHGLLSCKRPSILMVPGGTARHKATALGEDGMQAIRDYVSQGGHYIGFCGGAGLGLSGKHGLGLCPWTRARITDRMQHFVSGHIHVSVKKEHFLVPELASTLNAQHESGAEKTVSRPHALGKHLDKHLDKHPSKRHHTPSVPVDLDSFAGPLPIWWPGRFAEQDGHDVEILARYVTPNMVCNKDFWVADLPLSALPHGTFDEWSTLYNIHLRPTFLEGQPCIVHGKHGQGTYTLSYSHLETPNSPAANAWLVHLIEKLTAQGLGDKASHGQNAKVQSEDGAHTISMKATSHTVPEWDLESLPNAWLTVCPCGDNTGEIASYAKEIHSLRERMAGIMRTGMEHSLLFRRNAWLIGWRTGIAGGNLNNLHAA